MVSKAASCAAAWAVIQATKALTWGRRPLALGHVIGEVHGGGEVEGRDQAAGVQVGLGQGALGQGHAAAAHRRLDHQAGLVEAGPARAVHALDPPRGQPHGPVRATVVSVGRAVVQQDVAAQVA
jgi:hypothetical protein